MRFHDITKDLKNSDPYLLAHYINEDIFRFYDVWNGLVIEGQMEKAKQVLDLLVIMKDAKPGHVRVTQQSYDEESI